MSYIKISFLLGWIKPLRQRKKYRLHRMLQSGSKSTHIRHQGSSLCLQACIGHILPELYSFGRHFHEDDILLIFQIPRNSFFEYYVYMHRFCPQNWDGMCMKLSLYSLLGLAFVRGSWRRYTTVNRRKLNTVCHFAQLREELGLRAITSEGALAQKGYLAVK
jgi:hypothetical protein